MIKPNMRWRDRQTIFRDVILPGNMMSGKLFAIGSCFAENVVGVLKARNVDARLTRAGLFYTPATIADYLETLARNSSTLAIFGSGSAAYAPALESKREDNPETLQDWFAGQVQADRAWLAQVDNVAVTLGLNEQIVIVDNGTEHVCRQLPPLAVQRALGDQLELRVMTVSQIKDALARIAAAIRTVNPAVNILFTVSPVPLHATFQKRDIRVANARSKYALYAALQEFLDEQPGCYYFPSFEHAQTLQREPGFWEDDERHVSDSGVGKLMEFLAAYAGEPTDLRNTQAPPSTHDLKRSTKKAVKRGLRFLGLVGSRG
ncbi:GSCFA domain-containing protein [Devosia ginsengisoli]|uniref:GSCFA domain-containing protein n=1 Tax=Devosia ginsengisoli TaxID=400770 RepID=UPI0026EF885F|nr:GSCFA domain-containing protein [Devosia ginsengisoli]MCR6672057.1 GSCFA domain-containing protein [Devosia ginsengisoli]